MHKSRSFFKKTRRGKILRIVADHFLRDDIGCGSLAGNALSRVDLVQLGGDAVMKRFLVLDTNVVLNQMDLLEFPSPALSCVIVLQTMWCPVALSLVQETRHNNLSLYRRLKQLIKDDSRVFVFFANEHHCETYPAELPGESPNDRNDRAIRQSTAWFGKQLGNEVDVLLLTNDRANLGLAREANMSVMTIHSYVASLQGLYPDLPELLVPEEATATDASVANGTSEGARVPGQRTLLFPEHRPMSELTAGIRQGRFFQGTLRAERGSSNKCYVVAQGMQEYERIAVYIRGAECINRGVDGDIVAFELLPEAQWFSRDGDTDTKLKVRDNLEDSNTENAESSDTLVPDITAQPAIEDTEKLQNLSSTTAKQPCGRVVGIIRRHWREKQYCGSLKDEGDRVVTSGNGQSTSALFVPVDKKIPWVRIQTRQRAALRNKRILVAMDSWPAWSRYPTGHYVKTVGEKGEKATETEMILMEHDIPHESFSGKVIACLPPNDWAITAANSLGRKDLRHLPVLSIDPPGCKDIDDALHARTLENGNIEVGVHIADVTYFVEAGSAMDEEAALRSTSTYLVERRLDMLPGLLTETLCSLRANVDRFAFSVIWEMTCSGEIIKADFCKSIIHSVASLTYNEAQLMLDNPNTNDIKAQSVRRLNDLAKVFRKRRLDAGALTLASPEVRFVLDSESQNPTDVQMYALKEANALVEEFMLLANITVGKKILRHFPTLSVLRRHPAPSRQQFEGLLSTAEAVGVKLEVDDSKKLADSLDEAVRDEDPYFNKLLRILSTRCMMPAQYFCSGEKSQDEWHHYGLAAPVYTHFTSPIRRYADICVHRLLGAAIGVAPLPTFLMDKAHLHDLTENMNRRHRAAQLAGRASVALHTELYFEQNPTEENAYVLTVDMSKLTVIVPRFGIEGTIKLDAGDGEFLFDVEKLKLRYLPPLTVETAPETSVQVLDKVRVHVDVVNSAEHHGARMTLVHPVMGKQTCHSTKKSYVGGKGHSREMSKEAEDGHDHKRRNTSNGK
ncbi:unnamed protein product [Choristocarpus tenellus]